MAKLSALQSCNEVLKRIGESTISTMTALTTVQLQAFDNLNRALEEIAEEVDSRPLETDGTITLLTSTSTYSVPSDYRSLMYESVRQPDSKRPISVITADEFDLAFPKGVDSDRTGYPDFLTEKLGKFFLDRQPTAAENNKTIRYRYQAITTLYSTATQGGTAWMPEGFDRTLLCDYATWMTMQYMGHPEVGDYHLRVFGSPDNNKPEGALSKFKRKFSQPFLKANVRYVF